MGINTDIQWTDSTVNPTMGCDGCELWNNKTKKCYAGQISTRYAGRTGYPPAFEIVILKPGRMGPAARLRALTGLTRTFKPWLDGLPRLIFVSDMSDALSKDVSFPYLEAEIITTVTSPHGQRHCWQWLTKRPERMAQFSKWLEEMGRSWPPNLWAGTSITTQQTTTRVDHLLEVGDDSTIRFLSVEPQWEPINLGTRLRHLNWVIQGGESGRGDVKEFKVEWAYKLLRQCQKAKVPYFLKQLGSNVTFKDKPFPLQDSHGGDWDEWPADLRVREMPRLLT